MIEKIKSWFKDNYKFLISMLLIFVVCTYSLPYSIYTPGGAINMSERITGTGLYEEDGSISMTYVSMVRGSLPFLAISYLIPNWDIVKNSQITYEGEDLKQTLAIEKVHMKEAISNATLVAYQKANIDYSIKDKANIITHIANDKIVKLKTGDVIVKVDDLDVESLKDVQNYVATKSVDDEVTIYFKHNGKEDFEKVAIIDVNGTPKVGIGISTVYEYDSKYDIAVKSKASESGPSGGFMTALAIYNSITKEDLTGGLKIMGTGTIDIDGNVGEIGGVKYKLAGAVKHKADVFICPFENLEEANSVAQKNHYDIVIIGAKTFDEAIEKLNNVNID